MDHLTDHNFSTLYRIRQLHSLPDFVKEAKADPETASRLPPSSFADPAGRKFPCHTRADTFLSYAYFLKNAGQLPAAERPAIFARLRDWASRWAIYGECEQLRREHEKLAAEDLRGMPDQAFAVVEQRDGLVYRALPLINVECVKRAAEHLRQYRLRYPAEWRRRAARRVVKQAKHFACLDQLDDYVKRAASEYPAPGIYVAMKMRQRAALVKQANRHVGLYGKFLRLADFLENDASVSLIKLAGIIDLFDRRHGLTAHYDRGLPLPEEVVWNDALFKAAQERRRALVRLITGKVYTKEALARAGLEPFAVLGDDFIRAICVGDAVNVEKLAAIAETLPRPDAELLQRSLRAAGVRALT